MAPRDSMFLPNLMAGEDVNFSALIIPEWWSTDFDARLTLPSWNFGQAFDFSGSCWASKWMMVSIDDNAAAGSDSESPQCKIGCRNHFGYNFGNPLTSCWYQIFLDPGDEGSIGPCQKAHTC
jgi:hypothetical protein